MKYLTIFIIFGFGCFAQPNPALIKGDHISNDFYGTNFFEIANHFFYSICKLPDGSSLPLGSTIYKSDLSFNQIDSLNIDLSSSAINVVLYGIQKNNFLYISGTLINLAENRQDHFLLKVDSSLTVLDTLIIPGSNISYTASLLSNESNIIFTIGAKSRPDIEKGYTSLFYEISPEDLSIISFDSLTYNRSKNRSSVFTHNYLYHDTLTSFLHNFNTLFRRYPDGSNDTLFLEAYNSDSSVFRRYRIGHFLQEQNLIVAGYAISSSFPPPLGCGISLISLNKDFENFIHFDYDRLNNLHFNEKVEPDLCFVKDNLLYICSALYDSNNNGYMQLPPRDIKLRIIDLYTKQLIHTSEIIDSCAKEPKSLISLSNGGLALLFNENCNGLIASKRVVKIAVFDSSAQLISISNLPIAANQKPFSIYPNPTSDILHLDLQVTYPTSVLEYQIFSTSGQRIKAGEIEENANQINVSALSPGLYILNISGEHSILFTKE